MNKNKLISGGRHATRRFGLIGLMVLTAGFALGISLWIWRQQGIQRRGGSMPVIPNDSMGWFLATEALLLGLSWAVVAAGLPMSRPQRRRVTTRPGFAACFAVVISSLCQWLMRLPNAGLTNPT